MGKNKKIRNLELEVERLRKNVIDRENAIDKLLSDTITDGEKNVIKLERQFAKSIQKEFDRNLLSGSMVKGPSYDCVNGTFTPTDKQKADVKLHRDKIKSLPDKNTVVTLTTTPIRMKAPVVVGGFIPGIDAGLLKKTIDLIDKLSDKEVKENRDKLLNNMNIYNKQTNLVDNPDFVQSVGRQYRHTEEGDKVFGELAGKPITHHKVPQDDCVPKIVAAEFNVEIPNKDFSYGFSAKTGPEIKFGNNSPDDMVTIQVPVGSFIVPPTDNKTINEHLSVIQEELQKEMDNTVILKNVNVWGHNVGDVIVHKSELLDGGQNNKGSFFITNPIEQEFRLKNHKDIATFEHYEKYIFLSDYHISSPYINQDIVIKEGTIISLLGGNTYGSENTMVLFPYQNVKIMEEKRLVRRLSPLEICGEPQVCAPAKEEERQTPIVGSFKLKSSCIEGTHAGMIFVFDVNDKKGSYINKVSDNHTIRISEEIMNQLFEDGDAEIY